MPQKSREYRADIAIIGAGIAGYCAAIAAVNAGKRALLVHRGPGGTALSSGLFDGFQLASVEAYQSDQKATTRPTTKRIYDSLQPLIRQSESPVLLADVWGRAYQVYSAQETQYRGDLTPLLEQARSTATQQHKAAEEAQEHEPAPLIGIIQFGYHRASPDPAIHFNRAFGQDRLFVDLPLDIPEAPHKAPESPFFLASRLDQELAKGANEASTLHQWSAQINKYKQRYPSLQQLLFPPVLGCAHATQIVKRLTETCQIPCAELLATTPSLPGYRLYQHIQQQLQDAGELLTILEGTVKTDALTSQTTPFVDVKTELINSANRLDSCDLVTPAGETFRLYAAQWVLATGGWTGGGLAKEVGEPAQEQVFGLPLVNIGLDQIPKKLQEIPHPAHGKRSDTHVSQWLLHTGVMLDAQYRLCSAYDMPFFENVRAAGAVVATSQLNNLYETSIQAMDTAFAAIQEL